MKYSFRGWIIGKLIFTSCVQGHGAPFCDSAVTHTVCRRKFLGKAFLLTPWRRNQYGEALPQPALVIGWEI